MTRTWQDLQKEVEETKPSHRPDSLASREQQRMERMLARAETLETPAVEQPSTISEAGAAKKVRTIRDEIQAMLARRGITAAVGFEIVTKNGEQFTVVSDVNPNLERDADEISSINLKQSAKAGGV